MPNINFAPIKDGIEAINKSVDKITNMPDKINQQFSSVKNNFLADINNTKNNIFNNGMKQFNTIKNEFNNTKESIIENYINNPMEHINNVKNNYLQEFNNAKSSLENYNSPVEHIKNIVNNPIENISNAVHSNITNLTEDFNISSIADKIFGDATDIVKSIIPQSPTGITSVIEEITANLANTTQALKDFMLFLSGIKVGMADSNPFPANNAKTTNDNIINKNGR
ncbi:MAG: hypothetical protein FWE18_04475 [Alphaproteobacteria bacterium]|nr:hypothetical protein [Alphaproteobacteria bacterium]